MTLDVEVAGALRFRAADCPPAVLDELRAKLRVRNPEHTQAERYAGGAGDVPEWLIACTEHGGVVEVPRGAIDVLRRVCKAAGVALRFADRMTWDGLPTYDWRFRWRLRPDQVPVVRAMRERVQGVVKATPAAGKTVVTIALVTELRRPALVLMHTKDLLAQWVDRFERAAGIEAGRIGEGVCDVRPVTVALMQSVSSLPPDELEALGRRFGVVVVDECHHAAAATYRATLRAMPARYRIGLSGTPERDDKLTPFVWWMVGGVIHEVTRGELIRVGALRRARVVPVRTSFRFEMPELTDPPPDASPLRVRIHEQRQRRTIAEGYREAVRALVEDEERNRQIADLAAKEAREGCVVLVLTGRVDHCTVLADLIRARGVEAGVLTGKTKRTERPEALDALRRGELPVLVATLQLASEGLDVPRLDRMLVVFPTKAAGQTTQRLGRLMRCHPDKRPPTLYDFIDGEVGGWRTDEDGKPVRYRPFLRQWKARSKVYEKAAREAER